MIELGVGLLRGMGGNRVGGAQGSAGSSLGTALGLAWVLRIMILSLRDAHHRFFGMAKFSERSVRAIAWVIRINWAKRARAQS